MMLETLPALVAIRERLNEALLRVPEYRALAAAIDGTIQEISQILGSPAPMVERAATSSLAGGTSTMSATSSEEASESPASALGQSRMAMAIANSIETNVSPMRTQQLANASLRQLIRTNP